jgi:hypothetical protein
MMPVGQSAPMSEFPLCPNKKIGVPKDADLFIIRAKELSLLRIPAECSGFSTHRIDGRTLVFALRLREGIGEGRLFLRILRMLRPLQQRKGALSGAFP